MGVLGNAKEEGEGKGVSEEADIDSVKGKGKREKGVCVTTVGK